VNESLELARPFVLVAWVLLPVYALLRRRWMERSAVAYPPLQDLQDRQNLRDGQRRAAATASPQGHGASRLWALVAHRLVVPLEVLLLAIGLVGLAGPHRRTILELVEDEGVDVALVLDASLSMLAEDFPPNRLEALRRLARDLIARSGGNRLSIVLFALDPYVQSPLTTDHRVLAELLEGVTVHSLNQSLSGGTAIGDALLVATEQLTKARVAGRDQALVLITDGESNRGIDPVVAARYVREQGVRLYAIGVGGVEPVAVTFEGRPVGGGESPYLAAFDETQLRAVATAADGQFYRATDVGALEEVLGEISRLESSPLEARTVETRRPLTGQLSLVCLLLYTITFTLSGVVLRRPFR